MNRPNESIDYVFDNQILKLTKGLQSTTHEAAVTNLRAMTWSSIREIRGDTTRTTLPLYTAGY